MAVFVLTLILCNSSLEEHGDIGGYAKYASASISLYRPPFMALW